MKKLEKKNISEFLALTPMQEGILFHYLKDTTTDHYFEQLSLDISGKIVLKLFSRAWEYVTEKNEILRSVFRWEKLEKPIQVILKKHIPNIKFFDLSSIEKFCERQQRYKTIKFEDKKEKFDLREVPFRVILCKISDQNYNMVISNHHILYDGWSSGIILKEFFQYYENLQKGKPVDSITKPPFKEFINQQFSYRKKDQKKFWEEYLEGFHTQSQLPIKIKKHKVGEIESHNLQFILEKGIMEKLTQFLHEKKVTAAAFFYFSWGLLLQKYCGCDDIIFGTTVSGRNAPLKGIENMVGLFINTIPIRITAHSGEILLKLLGKVNEAILLREKYDSTPLVDIKKYSPLEANQELFDTLLVIENYPLDSFFQKNNQSQSLKIKCYSIVESTNYDLNIAITWNRNIEIRFIYNINAYTEDVIYQIFRHLNRIIMAIVDQPYSPYQSLEILSRGEKIQLLADFNKSEPEYPVDKTINGLFLKQVNRTPDSPALVVSQTAYDKQNNRKNTEDTTIITYRELDRVSSLFSAGLMEKVIKQGALLSVMLDRSIEMMVVILGILKAGCAYVPLNPQAPTSRNQYVLDDCAVNRLITDKTSVSVSGEIDVIHSQDILLDQEEREAHRTFKSFSEDTYNSTNSLAYIIYTSGSTGKPRGVPITHGNFSPLVHWGYQQLELSSADRSVQNLSYYFDWSVWEMFIALTSGPALYMVTGDVVIDSEKYLDYIQQHAITILHITPTHFQSVLHANPGNRLKSLKYLCIGAEKLSCDLVERSYTWIHEDCRVFNMYGPTETTIMAAVLEIDKPSLPFYKELSGVPIGETLGNTILMVLDRHLNLCPLYVPGELHIGGNGVSRGYLNNPELTAEKFCLRREGETLWDKSLPIFSNTDIAEAHSPTHSLTHATVYKSGDLTRWLPEGIVEFLGRIDQQVKIRGFRIEPGEIENHLLLHKDIKEALVISREFENGDRYLCAYVIPYSSSRPSHLPSALKEYLSGRLPDYMVPTYFVLLNKMPLNPNGKVDIKALPGPIITATTGYIAPRSDIEQSLAAIWADILGFDDAKIGIDDDFFELGGHSLNVTSLIGRIHKKLNIELPYTEVFVNPTIRELSVYIGKKEETHYDNIAPVEKKEFYLLSSAQKRLFVLQQMEAGNTAYNICGIMEVIGAVEKEKFEAVFRHLISRHESLRTSFEMMRGEPVQRVHDEVKFEIAHYHITKEGAVSTLTSFIRPFDLSHAPLLRVGLELKEGGTDREDRNGRTFLLIDLHHIISDGASISLLMKDFAALYEGERPPTLDIQYKEFSEWQNSKAERKKMKKQKSFWLKEFSGEIPVLNLPTDYSRSVIQDLEGCTLRFEIPVEHVRLLKELAGATQTTLYMVLLALYNILLSKMSGQIDIVVGTPVTLRRHENLEKIVGMFINTLALRNYPYGDKSFAEFLSEVKERTLDAFENPDYPYEDLVEIVALNRNTGRNPLFDTMFAFQKINAEALELRHLTIKPHKNERGTSKFDLSLIVTEMEERVLCGFEYSTKLFKIETIERFISYFQNLVSSAVEDTGKKISDIKILPENEVRQLLEVFNHTSVEYPKKTVTNLFEEGLDKHKDRAACFAEGNYVTYADLNRRVNALAGLIEEL